MSRRTNIAWVIAIIAVLVANGAVLTTAIAQTKAPVPKPQDKAALAADEAKQLLLLMDADKTAGSPNKSS